MEPTTNATYARTHVWALIFRQSSALVDAGLRPMPEPPFDGVNPWTVAKRVTPLVVGQIPPLPDEVALPVLREATRWLDKAEQVIESQARYFSDKANLAGTFGPQHRGQVRNKFDRLADACIILVQALTGLRIGEICGLLGGWDEQAGLPVCVSMRPSKTGLNELFYLCGKLAKTRSTVEDVEWLLGSRPRDSNILPLPIRALIALERLMAPWRALCQADQLIVRFRQGKGVSSQGSLDDNAPGGRWLSHFAGRSSVRCAASLPPRSTCPGCRTPTRKGRISGSIGKAKDGASARTSGGRRSLIMCC